MGLATTLAVLGIAASFAGKAYGQIGQGLPLAASGLAVLMGLNLLEVLIHVVIVFCLLLHKICWPNWITCRTTLVFEKTFVGILYY